MRFLGRGLTGVFLLGITLALLAVAAGTLRSAIAAKTGQEPPAFAQRERLPSVDVVTVTGSSLSPVLETFGSVVSRRTLVLRAPVGGTVVFAAPSLVEGGTVAAGDVLLRLDPTEAETALALAKADLVDAEAEQREAERALAIANDSLTEAQAQATLRQAALQRAQNLRERGTLTAADLETAELAVAAANSSVLSQRQSLAQAEARLDQAGTALDRVGLAVAEAARTLDDTVIVAPFEGALTSVAVLEGGRVTANETIAELVDPSILEVSFRVSTEQYVRLLDGAGALQGLPVEVALETGGREFTTTGTVIRESATVADGQTGRLLYAAIDPLPALRPGDFVTVRVQEPVLDDVALVPATTVGADGAVLALGAENRLNAVPVMILRRQGDDVIIPAADLADRRIIAVRTPVLSAGMRVQVNGEPTEGGRGGPPDGGARPAGAGPRTGG